MIQADAPQLYLTVDEAKALAMGVAISDVYDTLGYFMGGKYVNDFTRIGKIFRVIIQADAPYRMTPESIFMSARIPARWCRCPHWRTLNVHPVRNL